MATYIIPKITPSVFNSSDYIDTSYLTKKEADDLYINELPESVEKLIGNINIIGEETVSSQVVTGNCVINGNLTSGKDGFNGTTATTTVIKGNVALGDQNNTSTETTALGKVTLGWTQPINIRGSEVFINSAVGNGTTATTIGNGSNTLTVNASTCSINTNTGATGCNIGRTGSGHSTNIQGNVTIGTAGVGSATTLNGNVTLTNNLTVAGSVTMGNTDPISIRGSIIDLNTVANASSTNLNIGRVGSAHLTTINGKVDIGDQTDITSETRVLGKVKIGWQQDVDIRGSTININTTSANTVPAGIAVTNIGNGTGQVNINSKDVTLGIDGTATNASVTQIKGRTIAIGNTPPPGSTSSGIQIGAGGLVADAVNGQTNTFVSTVNKIFNPKICDAWGNTTSQNFNLNSPSCAVFSAGTRYVSNSVTLPSVATRTVYLNVPDLTTTMTYPILLDFTHFVFGGYPTTNTPSTVLVGYTASTSGTAIANGETRSKSLACNLVLCVAKGTSSSAHNYYFLPNINTTTNPFVSTNIKLKVNNNVVQYDYYPFAISKVSETKLRIDVNFPQSSTTWSANGQSTSGANNEFVYSLGFSIRLQSSPASNAGIGLFPNNSTDSPAGSCWLSSS